MHQADGFDDFAHAHVQRLGRVAWLLTGDHHAAEDLVQDTLVKLYVHWSKVTRASDPLRYARTTMLHTFISGRRKRSSTERPTDADSRTAGRGRPRRTPRPSEGAGHPVAPRPNDPRLAFLRGRVAT